MSLLDHFRRKAPQPDALDLDAIRRLGRLEAEIERLGLQWAAYRDELKRLVQRLEKREQRAEQRADQEREARVGDLPVPAAVDEVSARVLARRNAMIRGSNGLSE